MRERALTLPVSQNSARLDSLTKISLLIFDLRPFFLFEPCGDQARIFHVVQIQSASRKKTMITQFASNITDCAKLLYDKTPP